MEKGTASYLREEDVRRWHQFLKKEIGSVTHEQNVRLMDIASKLAICEAEGRMLDLKDRGRD